MLQPDAPGSAEVSAVSPLAARLSSVAYILAFVSVSTLILFLAAVPLGIFDALSTEQVVLLDTVLSIFFLITSIPTIAIAVVALRLMRDVPASVPQKVRAGRALDMGI